MNSELQPSHLPPKLKQELQSSKEAKQAAELQAMRLQTAMMKTLLLLRGLGVTLGEPKQFLMEVYEDAERKQHVILARWNLKPTKKERCKLLFEFSFDKDELTMRWFDKSVAANLPDTQERKAVDAKRWQALYKCFIDLDKRDNLSDIISFSISDSENEEDRQPCVPQ